MRELTFCTSNATKLAHARYLAEGRQVSIKGFRQKTYHADYQEPRLESRPALLEASYRNAIRQLKKANVSLEIHPFVLEDTSVKIDALCSPTREVPGTDIKYWIKDQTFENLDETLRARGNIRTASVRSDIVLHVPAALKKAWGIVDDFVVFVGEQSGTIVESELDFRSNLVFPWLDNQSFNKWFQPTGSAGPFGSLAIKQADLVDFRRKSFDQLFAFLEEKKFLVNTAKQMEFSLDRKPNFILCGYTCAGKTTASQHLARKFGYLHVEASDFMHLSYLYRHGALQEIAIGDFAEQALAAKPTIAAEKVAEYLDDNLALPVVISGFRAPEEIDFVKWVLGERGKLFKTLFVDADEATRFERLRNRARPGDELSQAEFASRDCQQERMGLSRICGEKATEFLSNSGDLGTYHAAIEGKVGASFDGEIDVSSAFLTLRSVPDVRLEDAILIALLHEWSEEETRPFFTTTKIAAKISEVFSHLPPKHKDNVSRYFNQDFYAYYEIEHLGKSQKRRYRLSNTGYGMAVQTLRRMVTTPPA